MGFTKFTKSVLNISGLPDRVQNQADKLKGLFDQAGVDIKEAHNLLIDELQSDTAASNTGAKNLDGTASTVQNVLNELDTNAKQYKQELDSKKVDKVSGKQLSTEDYTTVEKNKLANIAENANNYKLPVATKDILGGIKPDGVTITVDENGRASSITADSEDWTARQMVKDLEEDLTIETVEVSGTELEITNAGNVESVLHISGNSEQDSRSGKNLLKKGIYDYVSKTSNGITFTVNNDESVTISGKNNGSNNSVLMLWNDSDNPLTLPAGTYNTKRTQHNRVDIMGYTGSKYITLAGRYQDTVILDEDTSFVQIYIQVPQNTTDTFDNFKVYPMLVKDIDSLEPYEPYGVQPSPDYPSEIRSVSGKSYNVLKLYANSGSTTNAGVTVEMLDYNTIKVNGTTTKDAWVEVLFKFGNDTAVTNTTIIPLENTTYRASCFIDSGSWSGGSPKVAFIAIDGTNETQTAITYGSSKTFEGKNGLGRIFLSLGNGTTYNNLVIKLQVSKGTEVLPYQPYGYVPVEVKVEGKNKALWEIGTIDQNTGADLTSTTRAKAEFSITADEEYVINIPYARFRNLVILDNTGTMIGSYQNCTFAKSNNYFSFVSTISGKCKFIVSNDDGATNIDLTQYNGLVQIEKGSEPTQVVPYVEPKTISLPLGDIELRSTPDGTRDTFARVDGVWNKKHNVGNTIANGQNGQVTSIVSSYCTENHNAFTISGITPVWAKAACKGYSDKFKVITSANDINGKDEPNLYFGNVSKTEIWVKVSKEVAPTVADFKTWLPNNPIEIQYPLAEPTYTPITDQALISALDELEQLILHKGYNRITVTAANGVKAYLDLSYLKNNTGLEGTKEYVDRVEKRLTESIVSPGMILMWSGATNAVPRGWNLCDGTNGTPDLRDRFIVGAGNSYRVGDIGGSASVVLTVNQIPSHSHTMEEAGEHRHMIDPSWVGASTGPQGEPSNGDSRTEEQYTDYAGAHTHIINATGGEQAHENRPPYYALAYIMKL